MKQQGQITIFSGSSGLNTVSDEVRLPTDPNTGLCDLAQAVNVRVDINGRVTRRTGFVRKQTGEFHSVFCRRADCYVAKEFPGDCSILRVASDLSLVGVRSGLAKNRRISWAQDDDNAVIYYANGIQNGIIVAGVSSPWPNLSTASTIEPTFRHFSPAPVGHRISLVHGRMLIATTEALYYSEPWNYGKYDLGGAYLAHPVVRMIKEVDAGVFISTDKETIFYRGIDLAEASPVTVADYPALEWSEAEDYVEGAEIGLEPGKCALWASPEGLCAGTAAGTFHNLTKNKVVYPEAVSRGASLLHGYNLIHCMQ